MNRVVRAVYDADFRCSHPGLTKIAQKLGVNPQELNEGEFLVFLNRPQNAVKIFASNNTIAYFKMPKPSQRVNLKIISMIPRFFNGTSLNYEGALKNQIESELAKKIK